MVRIDMRKVKEIMINNGLTQTKLAEIVGVSRVRISLLLKNDITRVNYSTAHKLIQGLNVNSKDIIYED